VTRRRRLSLGRDAVLGAHMVRARLIGFIGLAALPTSARGDSAPVYDLVILHGRVMDPE